MASKVANWRLEYFPNGYVDSTSGCTSVVLWLLDNHLLDSTADVTMTYRVAILNDDGNAAYISAANQRVYNVRGMSGVSMNVDEAKADAPRGLTTASAFAATSPSRAWRSLASSACFEDSYYGRSIRFVEVTWKDPLNETVVPEVYHDYLCPLIKQQQLMLSVRL